MELKYTKIFRSVNKRSSFNRTFMELKSIINHDGFLRSKVLIVPLWN